MAVAELSRGWSQESAIDASLQGSSPAVDDEYVYVGDMDGQFYALSQTDGAIVWSNTREGALTDSPALYHDGRVYVGSGGGAVYAYASNGDECWRADGNSAISARPAVGDERVFVGRNDGTVVALGETDGSVHWQTDTGETIRSALGYAPDRDLVYVSTNASEVYALEGATGDVVWSRQFGAEVGASAPVVDEGRGLVYFAASEVMALDADSGESVWGTAFYGANAGSSPAFDDTHVYVGGADGSVYAIARPDGPLATAAEWTYQSWDVSIVGDIVLTDDHLVAVSLDGNLYVLETETGAELCYHELTDEVRASPVTANGSVYVGGADGTVFALE